MLIWFFYFQKTVSPHSFSGDFIASQCKVVLCINVNLGCDAKCLIYPVHSDRISKCIFKLNTDRTFINFYITSVLMKKSICIHPGWRTTILDGKVSRISCSWWKAYRELRRGSHNISVLSKWTGYCKSHKNPPTCIWNTSIYLQSIDTKFEEILLHNEPVYFEWGPSP